MADITSPREFLTEAREAAEKLNSDKSSYQTLKDREAGLDDSLSRLNKTIEKEKADTVRQRRQEIETDFDKQLRAVDEEIRVISEKRQKARQQGVKARVAEETAQPQRQIADLKKQFSNTLREAGIGGCANRFYFMLFMPNGIGEILALVLCGLAAFVGIPMLAVTLLGIKQPLFIGLIFAGIIAVFIIIYVIISNRTRGLHPEAVKIARSTLNMIKATEKAIKKITAAINRDKDDSHYSLQTFDDQLAQKNQIRENILQKKDEGLCQFDNVTKNVIYDDIDTKYRDEFERLNTEHTAVFNDINRLSRQIADSEVEINSRYTQYIGAGSENPEMLDRLIGLIDSGEAASITEAVNALKNK